MEDRSFFDLLPQSKRREVEVCLDVLNQTAPKINDLENNLLEARSFLNSMLMEKMSNLSSLSCRLQKCVEKARPYYHYKETQLELIEKIRLASDRYHKANERLTASQAAFSRIECGKTTYESMEDSATLETINLCIAQVNAAARELTEVKREHEHLLVLYAQSERLIRHLERWHSLSIKKAEPYFVKKRLFDQQVSKAKMLVDKYSRQVTHYKRLYAETMLKLEGISESLHQSKIPQSSPSVLPLPFVGEQRHDSPPSPVRGKCDGDESSFLDDLPPCSHRQDLNNDPYPLRFVPNSPSTTYAANCPGHSWEHEKASSVNHLSFGFQRKSFERSSLELSVPTLDEPRDPQPTASYSARSPSVDLQCTSFSNTSSPSGSVGMSGTSTSVVVPKFPNFPGSLLRISPMLYHDAFERSCMSTPPVLLSGHTGPVTSTFDQTVIRGVPSLSLQFEACNLYESHFVN